MEEQLNQVLYYKGHLNEKEVKRLDLNTLERLIIKVKIHQDSEIIQCLDQMINEIKLISTEPKTKKRSYYKKFNELGALVKAKYGYVSKGTTQSTYLAIGVSIGTALGVAFMGSNPAFIGIGIPIGVAIGVAIGSSKEKELEKQDKLY